MSEAFREIKTHLGPDAILLSTKEIPCRSGVWGRASGFEVVAACDDAENVDVYSASGKYPAMGGSKEPHIPGPIKFVDNLSEMDTYSAAKLAGKHPLLSATNCTVNARPLPAEDALTETDVHEEHTAKGKVASCVRRDLVERGVDASLAKKLLTIAWEGLTPGQRRSRKALIHSVSRAAFAMLPAVSNCSGIPGKKVVAFVGPTGVGKTTSIAKLAAHLALQKKKKVLLVTTDGYRIGAVDQLKTYAGLMGVPFCFVDQVPDLVRTIEENNHRDYILIDTAGRSPRDLNAMAPLSDYLRQSSNIERHLVLSVTSSSRDMHAFVDMFEVCGPDHLLFTKLDETTTPGPILNEIIRTQKSFSYYSDGQRVPEDLHPVTGEQIVDLVLNRNDVPLRTEL